MDPFRRGLGFWNGLAGPSRRLIFGAIVIFVVGMLVLWRLSGQVSYSTLATSASASEASDITGKLNELGIPYKLTDGGTTVQVPDDRLDQARLDLASSNLLDGGGVGFEIFDRQSLGATDFTQRVNLIRAMEGELSRTISRLEPVRSATVKIAMPEDRLFTSEQEPTTAGVVLDLGPGATLEGSQVKGISSLVAMAVPGLKPSDVTITDNQGNILEGSGGDAGGSDGAKSRFALEAQYEREIQGRLDAMLAATLGPGKAVTRVAAVLDLDKVTTDSEDFDPESSTPLESETSRERLESTGTGAAAPAGAAANTPPGATFPATTGATGETDYTKTTESQRNGVDRVRQTVERAPGLITAQSIAVQVSDEVPQEALAAIEPAVKAAVGFQDGRDQISVQAIPFAEDATATADAAAAAEAAPAPGSAGALDPINLAKTGAVVAGVLLLLFLARRSLRRRQGELESAIPELLQRPPVPVAQLSEPGGPVKQLGGREKTSVEMQMEDLAKRKPEDVAQLIRGWLLDG